MYSCRQGLWGIICCLSLLMGMASCQDFTDDTGRTMPEPDLKFADGTLNLPLEEKEYTAAAGGGAVEITVSGKKEIVKVKLAEEVVDPDDIEMLEDLIMAAANQAFRQMEEDSAAVMSKLTGGLGGGLPF